MELVYQGPNNATSGPGGAANRNIVREFASEFDAGECWGYNRFFRLDLLASEGYLRPDTNSLILRFHVRPPTYYQKCRDLQRYMSSLLAKQARYLSIIKDFTEVHLKIYGLSCSFNSTKLDMNLLKKKK